ncbi:hypothetical protein EVAR_58992_1 [Eumeta japonica]|uniref:Uncharacterized protein n=1 Tax=Eumeta variegata TaxID=151549 RepID=A0A4C1ZKH4_EUMVA|nr:hypothetical protein EVAR_58992_1 [Eumeta japonica]
MRALKSVHRGIGDSHEAGVGTQYLGSPSRVRMSAAVNHWIRGFRGPKGLHTLNDFNLVCEIFRSVEGIMHARTDVLEGGVACANPSTRFRTNFQPWGLMMEPEDKHRNSIMKQRILAVFGLVEIVLRCTVTMNDFQGLMMQLEESDNGAGSLEAPSSDP